MKYRNLDILSASLVFEPYCYALGFLSNFTLQSDKNAHSVHVFPKMKVIF